MDIALFSAALLFLTFCSAYFSASETALFSLSSMKVKAYQSDFDPRKRLIASLVLQPRDLLVTVFMLNTMVNILIQNVSSSMYGSSAGWGFKVGMPLVLMLLGGEIIPKYYGLQNNVSLSYRIAPSINFLQRLLQPIRRWIIAVTVPISRFMFFFLKKEEPISPEELQHVLKTSQAHGVLQPDEAELVWGVLNLHDMTVKELMRPREDMYCYDINEPLSKLTHLFAERKLSRIPVYDREPENIIGIITAKQYFVHHLEINSTYDLRRWLEKPFYVPENTFARLLLRRFEEKWQSMAIVVDEYGIISGLITREDILEVVVSKPALEEESKTLFTLAGENEIIASGKLELIVFNELFDSNLESKNNMVTLGGWLIEQLGEIPAIGTKYETPDFLFHVLSADPNRVRRIYVRKLGHSDMNIKRKPNPPRT